MSTIARLVARLRPALVVVPAIAGIGVAAGVTFAAGPVIGLAAGVAAAAAPFVMRFAPRPSGLSYLLGGTKLDYAGMVQDPSKNSIVVAVVGWIARNFPEAPVRVARILPKDVHEYVSRGPTGPGFMLRLLERPNAWFSGVLLWMATITDLYCTGNAYWVKVRNASGRVVELWWVPKAQMRPGWPADGKTFIGWYEYRPGDGFVYGLRPEDVVHFRDGIDPLNTRVGLSKLASLFREIYTDDESANFSASLVRNMGVPGVVISPSNTVTSMGVEMDPEKIKQAFMEKFGGDRRGEPLVLTEATDVKVLSFNPLEMDLKALRRVPEERISGVLGIAAVVAGLGAGLERSTFTNYGEARKAAYEESVIPEQRLISAEIEVQLLPDFADTESQEYDVDFDLRQVRALQEAADAIWSRNRAAASAGLITRAAFKRAVGETVADDGSDDVYVMPNNYSVVPVRGGIPPGGRPPAPPGGGIPSPAQPEAPAQGVAA
jgi:HK97 family phage portal protein